MCLIAPSVPSPRHLVFWSTKHCSWLYSRSFAEYKDDVEFNVHIPVSSYSIRSDIESKICDSLRSPCCNYISSYSVRGTGSPAQQTLRCRPDTPGA